MLIFKLITKIIKTANIYLLFVFNLLLSTCALTPTEIHDSSLIKQHAEVSELKIHKFIQEMVTHHKFDAEQLHNTFNKIKICPSIISTMSKPVEKKPWYSYRPIFINKKRIQGGVNFWKANAEPLLRAKEIYGIPPEYITAIIGVETQYGTNMGKYRVIDALSTLAFNYPKRSSYFLKELENFLLLSRSMSINPLLPIGSYAGAMGYGQFMPSSIIKYAIDFDGDGLTDLWHSAPDAIGSVANYFSKNGWQVDKPVAIPILISSNDYQNLVSNQPTRHSIATLRSQGIFSKNQIQVNDTETVTLLEFQGLSGPEYWLGFSNFYVITKYNFSNSYAMVVHQLSQEIRDNYYYKK